MSGDPVEAFLDRARALRDYVVYSGSLSDNKLIDALVPFDTDGTLRDARKLASVREATREACKRIEPYTCFSVLDGRSPIEFGMAGRGALRLSRSGWVVASIGILLLFVALYYSNWSTRAEVTLAKIDDLNTVDYSQRLLELVESATFIEDELRQAKIKPAMYYEGLEDFISLVAELQYYNVKQSNLTEEAVVIVNTNSLPSRISDWVRSIAPNAEGRIPGQETKGNLSAMHGELEKIKLRSEDVAQRLESTRILHEEAIRGIEAKLTELLARIGDAAGTKIALAGAIDPSRAKSESTTYTQQHVVSFNESVESWGPLIGKLNDLTMPATMKAIFQNVRQEIAGLLDVTNRWTLPAIYGALGAVVFSVSRHLNVFLSPPPITTSLLRILFGTFIAISISMIIIPANVFSAGNESSPGFVFLICFVFGYSVDSFIRLLRQLDTFLAGRLTPIDEKR